MGLRTRSAFQPRDAMPYGGLVTLAVLLVLGSVCGSAVCERVLAMQSSSMPAHVARVHHAVSTKVAQAQAFFDQGLTLLYAYNRNAARHAFEQAARADPQLAMAQWGIAIALGSNINVTIDAQGQHDAYQAVQSAQKLAVSATPIERAYIRALATRYTNAPNPNLDALAVAYKNAMADLTARFPDDLDAATLYAESAMELHPWALYTIDGTPIAGTQEIVSILESVMRRQPQHIGATHFYIHAVEASRHPERALVAAMRLAAMTFEPAAAHLVHMPAHTYMRTGDFAGAVSSNEHATAHDRDYLHAEHDPEQFSGYYLHNVDMLTTAYAMQGDFAGARRTADILAQQGSFFETYFVLMRFDRWSDVLKLAAPQTNIDGPIVVPFWHFARGLAFAASGDAAAAQAESAALAGANSKLDIPGSPGSYNTSHMLLGLAQLELSARTARARGDAANEIATLKQAVAAYDRFLYTEPPDWYQPPREALGGALLRAGRYADAEGVFRADLQRSARNPRSLFGLAAALRGEGRSDDAALVEAQFAAAWRNADTKLAISDL